MKKLIAVLLVIFVFGCATSPQKFRKNFSKKEDLAVWEKARPTKDPNVRRDICSQKIHLHQYGNTKSPYGWEIDHIKPVAKGGSHKIENLQPLLWKTNRYKSNKWPITPKEYCP